MLAQLCHVLTAHQSAQVAQKHQQYPGAFLQSIAQGQTQTIYGSKRKIRSGASFIQIDTEHTDTSNELGVDALYHYGTGWQGEF
jgi:uncharacterized protein YecA (UPF0149 family)